MPSDAQGIVVIIIVIIVAAITIKVLWRFVLGLVVLAVVGAVTIRVLCESGKIDCSFRSSVRHDIWQGGRIPPFTRPVVTPSSGLPDLQIVQVWTEPKGPVVSRHSQVTFWIQVVNRGNGPCYGDVIVRGGDDSHMGGFRGLMPGEAKVVQMPLKWYGGSVIRMGFTVDPYNSIQESNETNNFMGPLTITMY